MVNALLNCNGMCADTVFCVWLTRVSVLTSDSRALHRIEPKCTCVLHVYLGVDQPSDIHVSQRDTEDVIIT